MYCSLLAAFTFCMYVNNISRVAWICRIHAAIHLVTNLHAQPGKIVWPFLVHSTITVRLQMVKYSGYG